MAKGRFKSVVAASLVVAAASALQASPAQAMTWIPGAGQENVEGQKIQAKHEGYSEEYIVSNMSQVVSLK